MIRVGIVGGTGYTGVELLRLLAVHPQAEVRVITSRKEAGMRVAEMFPSLRGLPQFTSLAIALGHIVSGSVIVEVVFGFPGIGSLLVKAISGSDFFLLYGIVFMIILAISLATLLIDLVYPLLDPRIAYQSST